MLRRDSFFLSIVEEEFQHQVGEYGRTFESLISILLLQIEQNTSPNFPPQKTTITTKTKEVHGNLQVYWCAITYSWIQGKFAIEIFALIKGPGVDQEERDKET